MEAIYRLDQIPAHSCLLMDDLHEAVDYPRGDLCLGFCRKCGFIGNVRYDDSLRAYSPKYEETQHFSGRFNQFAEQLVDRLIEEYELNGKTILEIGCGKGEFLALLCQRNGGRGVGIDPACNPDRIPEAFRKRLEFVADYYRPEHGRFRADVIMCRHTLEHIPDTRDFVMQIRKSIAPGEKPLIFFEVPDVVRVLCESAFWDIYYEHCSYFSPGSLARLFRSCGFDVIELRREYGDQYLWLTAVPSDGPTSAALPLEDDLADLTTEVEAFRARHAADLEAWRRRLGQLAAAGRRPVLWGAGSKAVAFVTTLGLTDEVEYVVDINPYKQGKFLPGSGHPVVGPEFLQEYHPEVVVVMNPIYCDEIARQLAELGLHPELVPAE